MRLRNPQPHSHCPRGASFAAFAMASSMLLTLACGGTLQSTDTGWNVVRLKWLCGSTNPGSSVRPFRCTTRVSSPASLATSAFAPTALSLPSRTATASARLLRPSIVSTLPPISTRSIPHLLDIHSRDAIF